MASNHKKTYEAVLEIAKQLEPLYGKYEELNFLATFAIGNTLFAAPNIFMGVSTESAQYLPKPGAGKNTTWEHVWGRKNSAITIIEQIRKGKGDAFLLLLIKSRCRVALALRDENQKLKGPQNDEVISKKHPRAVYESAGLKWVNWVGNKVYNIDGVVYNSREAILQEYDITTPQLNYRLSKTSKKWKGWTIERIS
jgi:hypothetical protein